MEQTEPSACLMRSGSFLAPSGVESILVSGKAAVAAMPRKNLLGLFDDFARFGSDVAVMQKRGYRQEKLTYAELYTTALFWSHALGERGIGPGDRVLLWGSNSAEWVACF